MGDEFAFRFAFVGQVSKFDESTINRASIYIIHRSIGLAESCPYCESVLYCLGYPENGALLEAGLLCIKCGYLYDILSDKERSVGFPPSRLFTTVYPMVY